MVAGTKVYLSRLQILLVFLILNGTAKTKLAILAFLCYGEFEKYSINSNDLSGFPHLHTSTPACSEFLRFTSGAMPAVLLVGSMAAKPIHVLV